MKNIPWWMVPPMMIAATVEDVKTKISLWNDKRKAKKEKRFPDDYVEHRKKDFLEP